MTIMFTYVGMGRGYDLNILKAFPVTTTPVAGVVIKSLIESSPIISWSFLNGQLRWLNDDIINQAKGGETSYTTHTVLLRST